MLTATISATLLTQAIIGFWKQDFSTTSLARFATATAIEMKLNKEHFLATLQCESGFAYNVIGPEGEIGVAQIHRGHNPDVSVLEAKDPYWSILWMGQQWQKGYARWWTCWRIKYQPKPKRSPARVLPSTTSSSSTISR